MPYVDSEPASTFFCFVGIYFLFGFCSFTTFFFSRCFIAFVSNYFLFIFIFV
jgi:hypothetical protein